MDPTEDAFEGFVNVDETNEKDADRNDNFDLIPDECFTADTNPDKSGKFTCKQCSKDFK